MKKSLIKSLFVLFALSLTSCFHFVEELTVNNDGSGHYTFYIDMQQMMTMIKSMGNGQQQDQDPFGNAKDDFKDVMDEFRKIEGISNAKSIMDTIKYQFGIEFDFKNTVALNKAINALMDEENAEEDIAYFTIKKGSITRVKSSIKEKMNKEMTQSDDAAAMPEGLDPSMMFKDVTYTTKITVPSKVQRVDNNRSMLSADGKTVITRVPIYTVTENDQGLSNTITW